MNLSSLHIPEMSIGLMAFSCAMGVVIPLVLFIWFRRRGADISPFFVGCAVMLLFAFVLEAGAHALVFGSAAGPALEGNMWLYALYAGLMAGVFEESGRFAAFKTVLRKRRGNDRNALMYGAGHGGFEALVVLTAGMSAKLMLAAVVNSGQGALLVEGLPAVLAAQVEESLVQLAGAQPAEYLLGVAERLIAVALHIALSVLVWFAAKTPGRLRLFPAAIALHAAVDAMAVMLPFLAVPPAAIELVFAAVTAAIAFLAWRVWKCELTPAA